MMSTILGKSLSPFWPASLDFKRSTSIGLFVWCAFIKAETISEIVFTFACDCCGLALPKAFVIWSVRCCLFFHVDAQEKRFLEYSAIEIVLVV